MNLYYFYTKECCNNHSFYDYLLRKVTHVHANSDISQNLPRRICCFLEACGACYQVTTKSGIVCCIYSFYDICRKFVT